MADSVMEDYNDLPDKKVTFILALPPIVPKHFTNQCAKTKDHFTHHWNTTTSEMEYSSCLAAHSNTIQQLRRGSEEFN